MTGTNPEDPIGAAWAELGATIAGARAALDRARSTPVHTTEERRELHEDALSGSLGRPMRVLAERIEAGETSWGEVFEGSSPYSDLLQEHLTKMSEEQRTAIRQAVLEDEDFDPLASDI